MIRFVDLRGQDVGARFAFWDTITDTPIETDGSFSWSTIHEFCDDARELWTPDFVQRCVGLAPQWTHQPVPTNEGREWPAAPCILCNEFDPDHTGRCMSRADLQTLLAGVG